MTDFALYHLKSWKAGEMQPDLDATQVVVVDYDQTKRAYEVRPSDMEDFIEWVSDNWGGDNSAREIDEDGEYLETAEEHLDRIDCSVSTQ